MANVRKYGYFKPVKNNNPIRWAPRVQPKGNKRKALAPEINNRACPCCGCKIVPYQERCLKCGAYLWEVEDGK